jgi:hypothetical protein
MRCGEVLWCERAFYRLAKAAEGRRSASELSFNLFGLDIELGRGVDKAPS